MTKRGAPKGNLNALKSGKRSKQLKRLIVALMADPGTRKLLLALREMDQRRLQQLQDAVNHYAGLLLKPSRRRTTESVDLPPELLPANEATRVHPPQPRRGVQLNAPPRPADGLQPVRPVILSKAKNLVPHRGDRTGSRVQPNPPPRPRGRPLPHGASPPLEEWSQQ